MSNQSIHQLLILHLSDLHFGSRHGFNPPKGPDGSPISLEGIPTLKDLLVSDFIQEDPHCPLVVAISGDMTSRCEDAGFAQAAEFVKQLGNAPAFGRTLTSDDVYLVPGNHDVDFSTDDTHLKWYRWTKFLKEAGKGDYSADRPLDFVQLYDRPHEGFMMLTVNSEMHVKKGSPDEFRGQVSNAQLKRIEELLIQRKTKLESSIRVALIHHHPVLIPHLVEQGRQYDAVINSGHLLNLLHRHGFHLILHGHKHWPCAFTADTCNAYDSAYIRPLVVVSGGSVGSSELPPGVSMNCYNWISVKWNSGSEEVRVRIETRGLQRKDEQNQDLLPANWHWKTIRIHDRSFYRGEKLPTVKVCAENFLSPAQAWSEGEKSRKKEYARSGLNMAVVEVRPSLDPLQKYEAVFWIVGHSKDGQDLRKADDIPSKVTWSAGPMFSKIVVRQEEDIRFAASYSYYNPVLVQAELEFKGGRKEYLYVYARIPAERDFASCAAVPERQIDK